MKKMIIGLLLTLVLLTACAPDPRKEAWAQATVIEAQSAAKDAEQARQIAREQADAEKAKAEYQQAIWDANVAEMIQSVRTGIRVIGWSLIVSLSVMVIGIGWTVKETSVGLGRTFVQFAEVRAGLIHMDKGTRTYPGFVDVRQTHGTRFVAMLETGQVLKLDAAQPADRQLIAAFGQVSTTGVAFQEMRNANDAAGMAMFQPEVISARDGALLVGAEFVKALEGAER